MTEWLLCAPAGRGLNDPFGATADEKPDRLSWIR